MQSNVLNDLAKAKRRRTEKNRLPHGCAGYLHAVPSVRRSCSLMMPDRSSVRCSDVQVALVIAECGQDYWRSLETKEKQCCSSVVRRSSV